MVLKQSATHGQQHNPFESDVISDGTQTISEPLVLTLLFESDVISDGTQTHDYLVKQGKSLRVM